MVRKCLKCAGFSSLVLMACIGAVAWMILANVGPVARAKVYVDKKQRLETTRHEYWSKVVEYAKLAWNDTLPANVRPHIEYPVAQSWFEKKAIDGQKWAADQEWNAFVTETEKDIADLPDWLKPIGRRMGYHFYFERGKSMLFNPPFKTDTAASRPPTGERLSFFFATLCPCKNVCKKYCRLAASRPAERRRSTSSLVW